MTTQTAAGSLEPLTSVAALEQQPSFVSAASGLANDYLNLFNEITMMVEQLPEMPDLFEDIQAWRSISYEDYFLRSTLPGRRAAIDAYAQLEPRFRRDFETVVAELDRTATGAVAAVRRHYRVQRDTQPDLLAALCKRAGTAMRATLLRASALVSEGRVDLGGVSQARADRLQAVRLQVLREVKQAIKANAQG